MVRSLRRQTESGIIGGRIVFAGNQCHPSQIMRMSQYRVKHDESK
jgi:hypothetical protein